MRHRIVAALELAGGPLPPDADERTRELAPLTPRRRSPAAGTWAGASSTIPRACTCRRSMASITGSRGVFRWRARIGTSAALVDDARALYAEAAGRTIARLDEGSPVADGLLRLARAVNHEPRQLAKLIEGMLGERELWLPKLRPAEGASLRDAIDRLLRQALEAEFATATAALREYDWPGLIAICRRRWPPVHPQSPARVLAAHADLPPPMADARRSLGCARRPDADRRQPGCAAQAGRCQAGISARSRGPGVGAPQA